MNARKNPNYDDDLKNVYREMAVGEKASKNPAKVVLLLPSKGMLCYKLGLKKGTINKNTFCIFVEEVPKFAKRIRNVANFAVKRGRIKGFIVVEKSLERWNAEKDLMGMKIDLAFIDLCGEITPNIMFWIANQGQHVFADEAVISWTFQTGFRGRTPFSNKIIQHYENGLTVTQNLRNQNWLGLVSMDRNDRKYVKRMLTCQALYDSLYHFEVIFEESHWYKISRTPMFFIKTRIKRLKYSDYEREQVCNSLTRKCHTIQGTPEYYDRIRESKMELAYKKSLMAEDTENRQTLGEMLGLLDDEDTVSQEYRGVDFFDVSPQKRAHIKIQAKRRGLNPEKEVKKIQMIFAQA